MTTTLVKRPARIAPPGVPAVDLALAEPPGQTEAPPAATGAGMILMPVVAGAGSLTVALSNPGNPILVVTGLCFLVGAVSVGVLMIVSQRMAPKRKTREARERYLDYIEQMRHAVRRLVAVQRDRDAWRHPDVSALLDVVRSHTRRWERRPADPDFLVLRCGTGDQPLLSPLTLNADTGPLNEFDPVCLHAAQELQGRYAVLHDQPVTVDLRDVGVLSVLGDPDATRDLATSLLLSAVALHSPVDLRVAVVRADSRAGGWDWVKWLPHVQHDVLDGDVPGRLVTGSVGALRDLLGEELERRLDRHQRTRGRGRETEAGRHLLVVIDGDGLSGLPYLDSPDPAVRLADLDVHVLCLLGSRRSEPESVDDRVEVDGDRVVLASRPAPFRCDPVPPGLPVALARCLAPLRATVEDRGGTLAETVGLPEILGVDDPETLDPWSTWRRRPLRDLLRVPIGVGSDGRAVWLDLKESAHGGMGPHGLVVGATGSGKSEMLRTLVSSLVIGHGPDQLALMLVDFKGGATFAAMEHVPHLAGMITNLQDDLTLVDRMRDALFGEMQRRQEVLKAAGNLPNVTAYQERVDAGEPLEPLPHLLVIVDEFSELLTAKPDFAELFLAVGRIGRSIGVHLLLASQKLEIGKIRGLESHLSYRIGLRTFSEGESRDVIGVPDAFHLPPEPGSGYLKVDTTVFHRFKAALVSGPYRPPTEGPKAVVPVVPYAAVNGLGAWIAATQTATGQGQPDGTAAGLRRNERAVLDVLCARLVGSGAARTRPVWLDPLPSVTTLDELVGPDDRGETGTVTAIVGIVDDAGKQRQFPLEWDFTAGGGNLVVAGSPATGKSTLLATMVLSMSLRYAPGDVAFYCLDYGGGLLRGLEDLPHVAAVATRIDPERIQRTVNDVVTVLNAREALFKEHGLGSMRDFRRARADGRIDAAVPGDVFLVVDGWATFREEYDALEMVVGDVAARGLGFGVHVVLSVTQTMQVRMRMQPSFGGRLELRLNDTFDSSFDRKLMEKVSKESPGRGLTDVTGDGVPFQAALPRVDGLRDADDISAGLRHAVTLVAERWPSGVAKVRVLPSELPYEELPAVEAGSDMVPVGLSELNLGPAAVDVFGSSPHLLVFGDGETGKTNLLKVLATGLMKARTPEQLGFVVVDYRRSLLDVVPPEYLLAYSTSDEQTSQVAQEITAAVRKRIAGPDVTAEQLRTRSWWSGLEVVVLVDDYDLVATSTGNPLAPFAEFVPQGRDLGLHLLVSRRTGGLSRALFEPLLQRMSDVSTPGLLFSGDRSEGRLLANVSAVRLPVGRALYVPRGGGASQVQTARTGAPA